MGFRPALSEGARGSDARATASACWRSSRRSMAACPLSGSTFPNIITGRAGADEALRLLLSALELPTRDSETLAIVAERLIRYGETGTGDRALRAAGRADGPKASAARAASLALALAGARRRGRARRPEPISRGRSRSLSEVVIDAMATTLMTGSR